MPGGRGASDEARRQTFRVLVALPAVTLGLLLVVPLGLMVLLSTRADLSGPILAPFSPTLAQYEQLLASAGFLRLLVTSAGVAAIVAATATLAAYPLAYFLRFRAGDRAALYLLLLLLPFWASYLLRVIAWRLILGSEGALNTLLLSTGVIGEPISALLYNRPAVVVTLIYVWTPFAMLPILAALQRVDPRLHEAAADLYSRPLQQFLRVTLPLSMPGVVAAFFMVFIPTVGEYVTPLLVGGVGGTMYGNIIYDFFTRAANWPFGSALAVVMLVATLVVAGLAARLVNVQRLLGR